MPEDLQRAREPRARENSLVGLQIMTVAAQVYFTRYIETLNRVQKVINEIGAI